MAITFATSKVFTLGPAVALHGGNPLGHTTDDGVIVKVSPSYTDIHVDIYGDTPVDRVLNKVMVVATMKLAQMEAEVMSKAFPTGVFNDSANPKLKIGAEAGKQVASSAALLVLRPWNNHNQAPVVDAEDFEIYKAISADEFEIPYKFREQSGMVVTFMGLVDLTAATDNNVAGFGDPNA